MIGASGIPVDALGVIVEATRASLSTAFGLFVRNGQDGYGMRFTRVWRRVPEVMHAVTESMEPVAGEGVTRCGSARASQEAWRDAAVFAV